MTREVRRLAVVEAYVNHHGSQSAAAEEVGCSPANVGLHLARLGLLVQRDRAATLARASAWLAAQSFSRAVATRPVAAETVTVAARCHPDRQEFSIGLCRDCYRARRERSLATPVGVAPGVDARVEAELEGRSPDPDPAQMRLHVVRRVLDGQPLVEKDFKLLEAMIDGEGYEAVGRRLGLHQNTVKAQVADVMAKTGASSVVGVYRAIGWLRVDYDETMIQEFKGLLERLDGAIHRAMDDASRTRE